MTQPPCPLIDRDKFYERTGLNRTGTNALIDEYESRKLTDIRWLAYILATVKHETANTMMPIQEYGGSKYLFGMYDIKGNRPLKAKELGNLTTGDGVKYSGKGFVQVTGKGNYEKLTRAAKLNGYDWDFVKHPELMLQLKPSAWCAFHGMLTGLYTGKKLADYFNSTVQDWVNARRIINGVDKASLIAGYAQQFYKALV